MPTPDLLALLTPHPARDLDAIELEAVLTAVDDRLDAGTSDRPALESARRTLERDLSLILAHEV
jgi:hypothetical protein